MFFLHAIPLSQARIDRLDVLQRVILNKIVERRDNPYKTYNDANSNALGSIDFARAQIRYKCILLECDRPL